MGLQWGHGCAAVVASLYSRRDPSFNRTLQWGHGCAAVVAAALATSGPCCNCGAICERGRRTGATCRDFLRCRS